MRKKKILFMDDDENMRAIVECALEDNWEVYTYSSGLAAIADVSAIQPDVILLDVTMPEMDGKAVFGKLKENQETAAIPVLFMTAQAQTREVELFLSLGAAGVIKKPFNPMKLSEEIKQYCGE